jgi:hypothetical protein
MSGHVVDARKKRIDKDEKAQRLKYFSKVCTTSNKDRVYSIIKAFNIGHN